VGTASLIGPTAVMTNRHVAQEFCARADDDWVFRPGMTARIDFREELGGYASMEFEITGVIGMHEDRGTGR
jgi:glutamyl endopeptidase